MKNRKIILTLSIVLLILILSICLLSNQKKLPNYLFKEYKGKDSIHILNTGNSDCILLSSQGKYAIIDCGIDITRKENDEIRAIDRLLPHFKAISGEDIFNLEFAIGSHTHRDHISGYLDLLDCENVEIKEFYIKKRNKTGNKQLYNELISKMKVNNIPINYNVENLELNLGNFKIKILNGQIEEPTKYGDNDNSLAFLIMINNKKIFLAGDINNYSGDEDKIKELVGKVDVLKVPHHGYKGSSSESFMKKLNPEYSIITHFAYPNKSVYNCIKAYTNKGVFVTGEENGIVIVIDDEIKLYDNIHKIKRRLN